MRINRLDELEQFILDNKTATLDSLCQRFEISKNTLRRDVEVLVEKGSIKKVYGGVVAVEKAQAVGLTPFLERYSIHQEWKELIARKAASFVRDNDTIFLDSGTSTLPMIDYLEQVQNVTIITNSVPIIYRALNYPNLKVLSLPGILDRTTDSLVGAGCLEHLKNFHLKKGFMSCTGFSVNHGVCNASFPEYEIKKGAMEVSMEHYLLADHSKCNISSMMCYASLEQFDVLLTNQAPAPAIQSFCAEHSVRLAY